MGSPFVRFHKFCILYQDKTDGKGFRGDKGLSHSQAKKSSRKPTNRQSGPVIIDE